MKFDLTLLLGGKNGLNIQRDVLDAIMPKMLPLALVWLVYVLIKKRVSTLKIMIGIIDFSIITSMAGFL